MIFMMLYDLLAFHLEGQSPSKSRTIDKIVIRFLLIVNLSVHNFSSCFAKRDKNTGCPPLAEGGKKDKSSIVVE